MRVIRDASEAEFEQWYFEREARKGQDRPEFKRDDVIQALQATPQERHAIMCSHSGKRRDWFSDARWSLVRFDTLAELEDLPCLDKPPHAWDGVVDPPLPCTIGPAAEHLRSRGHFTPGARTDDQWRRYYHAFERGELALVGPDRIVLRSLDHGERPSSRNRLYLNDGLGRTVALVAWLRDSGAPIPVVEAYLTERRHFPQ